MLFYPHYLNPKVISTQREVKPSSLENSEKELIRTLTFGTLKTFGHDLPV